MLPATLSYANKWHARPVQIFEKLAVIFSQIIASLHNELDLLHLSECPKKYSVHRIIKNRESLSSIPKHRTILYE